MAPKVPLNTASAKGQSLGQGQWLGIAVFLVSLAVMGRIAINDFTWWDDQETLHGNPDMNPPTLRSIAHYWAEPHLGLYIPVTYTVWGTLARLAYLETPDKLGVHLNPWVFHSASVLIHAGTAVLVYALLRWLSRSPWAAAAGALVFALHPVQVEAVAWASGMKDLLAGFFSALALWQYVRFAQSDDDEPGTGPYVLVTAPAVLAMLSKPSAVVLPLLAAIIDLLLIRRRPREVLLGLWPWLVASIVFSAIAVSVQPAVHVQTVELWKRPLLAGYSLAFYLYKFFIPWPLAPDYGRQPAELARHGWFYAAWLVPAAVALIIWLMRRRAMELVAGGLIFLAGVLPVLGLVRFEFQGYSTVSDHYLYPSMIGAALAAAWAFSRIPAKLAAGISAVILLGWASLSFVQGGYWRDDSTLWTHTIDVNPRSWLAYNNLGAHLSRTRDLAGAMGDYERAVKLNPDFLTARYNLALLTIRQKQYERAAIHARAFIDSALKLPQAARPDDMTMGSMYERLGRALMPLGRYMEAETAFRAALEYRPGWRDAVAGMEQAQRAAKEQPR